MNKYELGIIIRADLEEEAFQAEMTRVKGLIERFEGTIDNVNDWGRRKLAYPITKLTEGMYAFITFTSEASAPREIEARLRLMENVLRFLVIRKDEMDAPGQPEPVASKPVEEPAEEPVAEAEVVEAEVVEAPEEPATATEE